MIEVIAQTLKSVAFRLLSVYYREENKSTVGNISNDLMLKVILYRVYVLTLF